METPQDLSQPKSQQSAKEWALQQDNQLRMAAALNHGSYGDSSGVSCAFCAFLTFRLQPTDHDKASSSDGSEEFAGV